MDKYRNDAYKTGEREFQLLLAAGLIRRFETISREDVYEKALKCFESLIEIRDSQDTAAKISSMIDRQAAFVQNSAAAIIDHLLFNKKNDPYLSLGLPRYAGKAEVNRRWKRLIVLYHPDKYPGQKEYEEKAKKINEAYEEIRKIKENAAWYQPANNVYGDSLPQADAAHYSKFLKYLPTFILALTIFMAIISILFFLKTIKDDRHLYKGNQEKLIRSTISNELRTPALMRHDCPARRNTADSRIL